MTLQEKNDIVNRFIELNNEGREDEANELIKTIPLPPYLAKAIKEVYGTEALIESGYDLSEADAEYGKNWLN
jgi:hypothetical protein